MDLFGRRTYMDFKMKSNMIYLDNEDGKIVAKVTFPEVKPGVVDLNHTFVDDSLRGQGVAGKLLVAAYEKIKEDGKTVIPSCWYADEWFKKHPEYQEILEKKEI